MSRRRTSQRPSLMVWIGGAAVALAVASAIAVAAFFVFRYDANAPESEVAEPDRPTLLQDASLRAGPRPDDAELARLSAGTLLELIGRSADGEWLVAAVEDERELVGWIPVAAVGGAGDLLRLTLVAVSGESTSDVAAVPSPASGPTFTPDYPDLAIEAITSRDNRLTVSIANLGSGDLTARVVVTVNGGRPQVVGAKPGEPLRAGARVEWVLPEEYVQRRAVALVTVTSDPPLQEETLENNTLEAIISPDLPNDLEIVDARNVAPDQHLQATLRNDSPIPIVGPATVTVRSTDGTSTLLGRRDISLDLAPGGTTTVDFPAVFDLDFTRAQLLLVTESINDADPLNNVFPR